LKHIKDLENEKDIDDATEDGEAMTGGDDFAGLRQTPLTRKELPRRREDEVDRLQERIANLTAELESREKELVEARHNSLSAIAEADNYKKRLEREHQKRLQRDEASLVVSFIPVLDTLDKALEQIAGDAPEVGKFREGIELTRQQFHDILSRKGLERIDVVGKPFDPVTSEALVVEDTLEHADGIVMREFTPGYMMDGSLARAARVIVARNPTGNKEKSGDEKSSD